MGAAPVEIDTSPLMVDAGMRLDEVWRKKHARWLREGNIWGLYFSAARRARDKLLPNEKQRLLDLIGLDRAKKLEDDLVQFMESLPRRYSFEFPIQTSMPLGTPEIKLSKTLALVEVQSPPPATSGLFGGPPQAASPLPEARRLSTRTPKRQSVLGPSLFRSAAATFDAA